MLATSQELWSSKFVKMFLDNTQTIEYSWNKMFK